MIIRGVPIALRDLPRQAADVLGFPARKILSGSPRPLALVYFSCARDFEILKLSLLSLAFIRKHIDLDQVVVVADSKDRFSEQQCRDLETAFRGLRLIAGVGDVHDRSAATIRTELNAFAMISAAVRPECLIGKVDSDVLFFSYRKLRQVVSSRAQFIGDKHWSGGDFFQGGLYFVDSRLLVGIDQRISDGEIVATIERLGCSAEDRVMSSIVGSAAKSTWNTNLMLFPDQFDRANLGHWFVRWEYSALHFFGCKHLMPDFFRRISSSVAS